MTRNLGFVTLAAGAALLLASGSGAAQTQTRPACCPLVQAPTLAKATQSDKDALVFMRQEEKLAHDVYAKLTEIHGARPFGNIGTSETRHYSSLGVLVDRYQVKDPTANLPAGKFGSSTFDNLYKTLVARGSKSLVEALRVGAEVEEIDILDLKARMAKTNLPDLKAVFGSLELGSHNHLRAFTRVLSGYGVTYEPQHLSPDVYLSIISATSGPGQGFGGRGQGAGAGRGQGMGAGRGQGMGRGRGAGFGAGGGRGRGANPNPGTCIFN